MKISGEQNIINNSIFNQPMTHEIQHLMQQLRLPGMRAAYEGIISTKNMQSLDNDELLNLLLQAEWDERENLKASRRLQNAKFRMRASIRRDRLHYKSWTKQNVVTSIY